MNIKPAYLFFTILLIFTFSAKAQQTGGWDGWTTVYTDDAYPSPHKVEISFKQNPICLGTSYYRTKSNFSIPNSYVSFNYDYLDCDGKLQTENLMVFLDTPKVEFSSTGSWYIGAKIVTRCRNVVTFPNPLNSNASSTSNSVTTSNYQTINNGLRNTNNGTQKNNANTNNTALNAQQQQTQQYINNAQNTSGDAIQQATALKLASIQANVKGGSTPQQQQQIQQVQQQQNTSNAQNTANLTESLGSLISAISSNKTNEEAGIALANSNRQYAHTAYENAGKDSNDPEVVYQVGMDYFLGGDNADSYYYFRKAANLGSVKAMKELAYVFYYGKCGFKPSVDDEKYWLAQAASNGNDIFSYYRLGWYSLPKDGDCGQTKNALLFFYKVENLCSQNPPKLTPQTLSMIEGGGGGGGGSDYGNYDYLAYCFTEKAIADIYSRCGEENKSEKESLTDAIAHYNKSLLIGDVHYTDGSFYYKKEIKKSISADEKRLKELGK